MIASFVMVLGYGVIAVPVGIVSSDIAQTVEAYRFADVSLVGHGFADAGVAKLTR